MVDDTKPPPRRIDRLCQDCVHCRPREHIMVHDLGVSSWRDFTEARCGLTDMVTSGGGSGAWCIDERAFGACGPKAIYFEPIPPKMPATRIVKDPNSSVVLGVAIAFALLLTAAFLFAMRSA